MATTPNEQFDDELLSAYLDGELDAASRAAVDERLRTDERARKLLAELRQASEAVKALPRVTVGRDLRGSVLASIEKAAVEPATLPMRSGGDVVNSTGRGWMWAGLAVAIAASVMVVAMIPQQLRNEDARNAPLVAAASKDAKERQAESGGEATIALADGETAVQPGPADGAPAAESETFAVGAGGKLNDAQSAARTAAAPMSRSAEPSEAAMKAVPPPPATAADSADDASGEPLTEGAIDLQVIDAIDVTRFNEILAENQVEISDANLPADVTATLADAVRKDGVALEAVLVEATPHQLAAIRQSIANRALGAARYADRAEGAEQLQEGEEASDAIRGRAWRLPQRQAAADQAGAPLDSAAPPGESGGAAGGEARREGLVRALFLIKRSQ